MPETTWTAWFDCGTTNTRLYLVDEKGEFLFGGAKEIGSRNVAIAGTKDVLALALAELFMQALKRFAIIPKAVRRIYASGMIASAYGLMEIPHQLVPVSAQSLRAGIKEVYVQALGRSICLIPGVRTCASDWRYAGNVRGEETEVFGAAAALEERGQCSDGIYVLPGSHTQILCLRNGQIEDICSLFTGELFHALQEETMLSGTLKHTPDRVDPVFLRMGCRDGNVLGINRALYLCHSNQVFDRFLPTQRYSYAEGVIHSGVVQSLEQIVLRSQSNHPRIVMVCDRFCWEIYSALLQGSRLQEIIWLPLSAPGCFGVRGLRSIVGNEGVHYE